MSGLVLPSNLPIGVGAAQALDIRSTWDTYSAALGAFFAMGFTSTPKPISTEFPTELTADQLNTVNGEEYTNMYAQYSAWYSYTAERLAEYKAHITQLDNMLIIIENETKRNAKQLAEKKITAEDMKEKVYANPEYQDVMKELQFYNQTKLLVEAAEAKLARSLRVISRQIEIRRQEMEMNQGGRAYKNLGR